MPRKISSTKTIIHLILVYFNILGEMVKQSRDSKMLIEKESQRSATGLKRQSRSVAAGFSDSIKGKHFLTAHGFTLSSLFYPMRLANTPFQLSGLVLEFFKISLACII